MAKLSRDDVLKLARLSRLHLTNEEVEQFAQEINGILQYIDQLQNINLEKIEPTYQVTGLTNVTRTDVAKSYGPVHDELLKNTPAIEDGHIKVRRML